MMVIRPVALSDLDDIENLAANAGTGLTTLPHSRLHLQEKIENSLTAFAKPDTAPQDECYLFVLEDSKLGKVVGTSGIVAAVGTRKPFYTYKINTEVHHSQSTGIYRKLNFLTLTNDFTDASELCTLFLSPGQRGGGNGILLSKSRFLFMAQFPHRFGDRIIAEMRGFSDENGRSPFWDNIGRHFFGVDFGTADKENGEGNNQFIGELMPHHPVYVQMLSPEAQAVMGQVHPQTKPALNMLKAEGLRYTGYIDIFDAGPTIQADVVDVVSIRDSRLLEIDIGACQEVSTANAILSNTQFNSYRSCLAKLPAPIQGKVKISQEIADALLVESGQQVRVRFY